MVSLKDSLRKNNYSPTVPASKPVSKTFVIIAIAVAALVVLGVLLLFTNQFVGKAISLQTTTKTALTDTSSSRTLVQEQAPTVTDTTEAIKSSSDLVKEATVQSSQEAIPAEQFVGDAQVGGNSLKVELVANLPTTNLKVGDKFWVDIYVTPSGHNVLGPTTIKLNVDNSENSPTASFTGNGQNGNLFTAGTTTYTNGEYKVVGAKQDVVVGTRYLLGKLELEMKGYDSFDLNLDKEKSSAVQYTTTYPIQYYTLTQALTKMVKTTNIACIPRTVAQCPQLATLVCGKSAFDDGCGGKIECVSPTPTCGEGLVCINNKCEKAVSQVLPAAAPQYDKTVLDKVSSALKAADKQSKLVALINAIVAWYKDPSNQ